MLAFSIGPRTDGEAYPKDTLSNIRETQDFVINIVSLDLANAMHESAINHPPEVDEFKSSGVTAVDSIVVSSPRVAEAKINMECTLEHILKLGSDFLVIGKMQRYHIDDTLFNNGHIDIQKLDPLGRMAGNYTKIETLFDLPLNKTNPV
jgi:flavin reductase (DIM6/NTAB) family NADH-FMN oxidoreductase RutF